MKNKWKTINSNDDLSIIDKLYSKKSDGYLVKAFLEKNEVKAILQFLEKWDKGTILDLSFGKTYGHNLMGSNEDLIEYGNVSEIFMKNMEQFSFKEKVLNFINSISSNREAKVPQTAENKTYAIANIRELHKHKGGLNAHIGNEFLGRFSNLNHLSKIADLKDQLSYFITLKTPNNGGGLVIFDLNWEDTPESLINNKILYYSKERNKIVEKYKSFTIYPEIGDLIIFSGGRIWHQVEDIKSDDTRISIGGFLAKSYDDKKIYIWS